MAENIQMSSGIPSAAAQAIDLKAETLKNIVDIKLLKKSLDFEQKMSADLLKSLGIGQLVDIIV
jgi:hypothetical protein